MANTKITINGQTYDGPEAMPPDVRHTYEKAMRLCEDAVRGATSPVQRLQTEFHVSVQMTGREDERKGPQPVSDLESRIRDIPWTLALIVVFALVLWYVMSR